jgi:hypothetical protein
VPARSVGPVGGLPNVTNIENIHTDTHTLPYPTHTYTHVKYLPYLTNRRWLAGDYISSTYKYKYWWNDPIQPVVCSACPNPQSQDNVKCSTSQVSLSGASLRGERAQNGKWSTSTETSTCNYPSSCNSSDGWLAATQAGTAGCTSCTHTWVLLQVVERLLLLLMFSGGVGTPYLMICCGWAVMPFLVQIFPDTLNHLALPWAWLSAIHSVPIRSGLYGVTNGIIS